MAGSITRGWDPGSPKSGLVHQGPGGGLPRMTGLVWLLSSALGVVCGGNSTLRSQKGAAGGSSSPSTSSTHCHGEPGGPILALVPVAQRSSLGLALSGVGMGGALGARGGTAWPMGWPEIAGKGHSLREPSSGPGFNSAFFPWRQGKQSLGGRRPRSTQCFIEKSQASAGSIRLSLVGVPAHSSLSQVFQQAGWGRIPYPPPCHPFPSL